MFSEYIKIGEKFIDFMQSRRVIFKIIYVVLKELTIKRQINRFIIVFLIFY